VPDLYIHMACLSRIGQGSALNLKMSERGISPSLFPLNLLHNVRQSRNLWFLRYTCISCVEHQWKEGLDTGKSELGRRVFNSLDSESYILLLVSYHIRPAFVLLLYDEDLMTNV